MSPFSNDYASSLSNAFGIDLLTTAIENLYEFVLTNIDNKGTKTFSLFFPIDQNIANAMDILGSLTPNPKPSAVTLD